MKVSSSFSNPHTLTHSHTTDLSSSLNTHTYMQCRYPRYRSNSLSAAQIFLLSLVCNLLLTNLKRYSLNLVLVSPNTGRKGISGVPDLAECAWSASLFQSVPIKQAWSDRNSSLVHTEHLLCTCSLSAEILKQYFCVQLLSNKPNQRLVRNKTVHLAPIPKASRQPVDFRSG